MKIYPNWTVDEKSPFLSIGSVPVAVHSFLSMFDSSIVQDCFLCNTVKIVLSNHYGPLCAPKVRNEGQIEDYVVYLKAHNSFRVLYQLAHELGHVLMKCAPRDENYEWIAETFCSVFSLLSFGHMTDAFAIRLLNESTDVNGQAISFGNRCFNEIEISDQKQIKKDYIKEYVRNISNAKPEIADLTPCAFIQEYSNTLSDGECYECVNIDGVRDEVRYRNLRLAKWIVEELGWRCEGLEAVRHFEKIRIENDMQYRAFCEQWRSFCSSPEEIHVVDTFQSLFFP